MNLKTLRLNDGILYTMSSVIYAFERITYIKDKRDNNFAINLSTRAGLVGIYPNDIIVNRRFFIGNGENSWFSLIFAYECAKKEAFVWL